MSQDAFGPQIPSRYNFAAALIEQRLVGHGDRPALECQGRAWTYAQVSEMVNRAGNAFRALGLAREQRVMIVLPDSPEFIAAYLGAIKIGAVAVPCNTFLGPSEYAYFLRETRAPLLVTDRDLLKRMEPALKEAANLQAIVLVDQDKDDGRLRAWCSWIESASGVLRAAETHKDEAAFWLWTSGSTGEPKAAVHVHQHPPWCCYNYARGVLAMNAADRTFSAAKLFHAYGLGNSLFFPFWVGATSILSPGRSLPDAVYDVIHRARPTIFFGVPTLFAAMLQVPDAEQRFDLSSIRFCVSAGESLPAELFRRWQARFATEILDGLGSTELLHMYLSSRPGRVRPGSTGVPVPGYEVKILDETGTPIGPRRVGDLYVKGPSTAIMYWNRREQTKQKMCGEWFVSGDKCSVDEDGYFWYAGRADDMFKVSGEWVSPIELESVLIQHESVVECAVVATPEPPGILKPKAFVVLRQDCIASEALAAELRTFVHDRAAHYKCPRVFEFVTELPKTATGKIQRFKLKGSGTAPFDVRT
jgi:benzoate-CoA ligase family protein